MWVPRNLKLETNLDGGCLTDWGQVVMEPMIQDQVGGASEGDDKIMVLNARAYSHSSSCSLDGFAFCEGWGLRQGGRRFVMFVMC